VALGSVVEEIGQEQQGHRDEQAVEHHRETRFGAGLQVDRRAGERTAGRISLEETAADVGQALSDQFLVGVEALLGLGGERFRHRDRFHEGDQGDDECG
jgi:hypothetical protein